MSVHHREQCRGPVQVIGLARVHRELLERARRRLVHSPRAAQHPGETFFLIGGENPQEVQGSYSAQCQGQLEEQFPSFHVGLLNADGAQQVHARRGVQTSGCCARLHGDMACPFRGWASLGVQVAEVRTIDQVAVGVAAGRRVADQAPRGGLVDPRQRDQKAGRRSASVPRPVLVVVEAGFAQAGRARRVGVVGQGYHLGGGAAVGQPVQPQRADRMREREDVGDLVPGEVLLAQVLAPRASL
ncbi:hypothetical protein ACIBQ1_08140 [Nonomuraea sp. NPDC050153]|uniref:hypothetical protein n=1 Tax=Nonomuraea sp. NPDC050153 TaxID=3364359 RepID=UPI003787BE98